jgi:hypothetical protein
VNDLLSKNNIGWAVISNLLRVKDVTARKKLEDKIDEGALPPSKIQDVVSAINKEIAGDKGTDKKTPSNKNDGPSINPCTTAFKKMNNLLKNVLTNKDSCAKDIQDLDAILDDDDRYERAVAVMEEFRGMLPSLIESLEELKERLDKTIA